MNTPQSADDHSLRVIASPGLCIEHGRIDRMVPEGATVAGHLRSIGWDSDSLNARVCIDGQFIPQAYWEFAVPKANQALTIRVIPMGGVTDRPGVPNAKILAHWEC